MQKQRDAARQIGQERQVRRPGVKALLVLLIVVIPIAGYVGYARLAASNGSSGHATGGAVRALPIMPGRDHISCVHGIAWSPDGALLAVVGQKDGCYNFRPGYFGEQGEGHLIIYDVATGHIQFNLLPDGLVKSNGNAVIYGAMAWSPDGQRLAVGYSIKDLAGTLVLKRDGTVAQLFAHTTHYPIKDALWEPYAHTEVRPFISAVWDTTTSQLVSDAPNPSSSSSPPYTFPQALSYQWGSGGRLEGATPIPAAPSQVPGTSGPVGAPTTGKPFTLWQPGALLWTPTTVSTPPTTRGAFVWHSTFVAWSPDGRYIAQDVAVQAALVPDGLFPLSTDELSKVEKTGLMDFAPSVLPIRDAGLAAVLKVAPHVEVGPENEFHVWTVDLAWRPDGRYLAAYIGDPATPPGPPPVPEGDHDPVKSGYGGQKVQVFDCVTGAVVAKLTLQAGEGKFQTGTDWLLWSADGSHLMRVDDSLGTITVWGPEQLPK
jgi:hypothetical protein